MSDVRITHPDGMIKEIDHPKVPMHGGCFPLPAAAREDWRKRMARAKEMIRVALLLRALAMQSSRQFIPAILGAGNVRSMSSRLYVIQDHPGVWQRVGAKAGGLAAQLDGVERHFLRNQDAEQEMFDALRVPEAEAPDDGEETG